MELLTTFFRTLALTVKDVFLVVALLVFFQLVVLRRPLPNWRRLALGFVFVLIGLTLFLDGLETALFPIGKIMAKQFNKYESRIEYYRYMAWDCWETINQMRLIPYGIPRECYLDYIEENYG